MSYFPNMFKSSKKELQSWLIHVNDLGDLVVYDLDSSGNAANMVAGKLRDVILTPIKAIYPICKLDIISEPDCTWSWGFRTQGKYLWETVRKSLVSKSSSEMRSQNRSIFDRWRTELEPYLIGQYWGASPDLAMTPKAIELDAETAKDKESSL